MLEKFITLAASSGERYASVWRPSVCLAVRPPVLPSVPFFSHLKVARVVSFLTLMGCTAQT